MGGRGGSSGIGNQSVNIPSQSDFKINPAAKLEGTQDQIKQVQDIRKDILYRHFREIYEVIDPYNPEKSARQAKEILNLYSQGKEKVIEYIKVNGIPISKLNKMVEKIKEVNSISQHSSAEWWIKNWKKL